MAARVAFLACIAWLSTNATLALADCGPHGRAGSTPGWNAAFCDFDPPLQLKQGQTITITLKNPAPTKVMLRLVRNNCPKDSDCDLLGYEAPGFFSSSKCDVIPVGNNSVTFQLKRDYNNVDQISIHSDQFFGKCNIDGGKMSQIESLTITQ
jgi:hypothetical protein